MGWMPRPLMMPGSSSSSSRSRSSSRSKQRAHQDNWQDGPVYNAAANTVFLDTQLTPTAAFGSQLLPELRPLQLPRCSQCMRIQADICLSCCSSHMGSSHGNRCQQPMPAASYVPCNSSMDVPAHLC
jgi:hypothetical protein